MKNIPNNRGFIGRLILLIIAIIALKYFINFDILEYLKSPEFGKLIQPIMDFLIKIYHYIDDFVRNIVGK
jgi:hypothetical protein